MPALDTLRIYMGSDFVTILVAEVEARAVAGRRSACRG